MALWCAAAGFTLSLLSAAAAVLSGFGYQLRLWHFRTGFKVLRGAFYGGIVAAVLSLFGGLLSPHDAVILAMAIPGIVVGGVIAYVPWRWKRIMDSLPYIHDITTDLDDPPVFVAVASLRGPDDHPATYDGPEVAEQQRKAYPDLDTFTVSAPRQRVLDAAQAVISGMGMQVVDADSVEGRIEATHTSRFYRFTDDMVVRVANRNGRVEVDARSKSRVGRSDMGQNARRIRVFLGRLQTALGETA